MLKRMMAIGAIALLVLATLAACGREMPEPPKAQVTKIPNVPGAPPQVYGKPPATEAAGGAASGQSTQAAGSGQAQGGGAAAGSAQTGVTVDLEDIKFVPNVFTIPANTPVKVTLDNKGALPHDFSITDHNNPKVKNLNISVTLQPGQGQTITIDAPAGDYYFFCNQPGHEAVGMHGIMHVVAGGAVPAAAQAGKAASPASSPAAASPAAATPAAAQAPTSVNLEAYDIGFKPKDFTIAANTNVTITIKNTGVLPHDFSLDALHLSKALPVGSTETVTINLKPGKYEYYCNQPGHKAAGMWGDITAVAGGGGAAPAPSSAPKPSATTTAAASSGAAPTKAAASGAATSFTLDLEDIKFVPNSFTIAANTPVKVTLTNKGALPHDFSVDKLHIQQEVDPGKTVVLTINAPAGTYQFYCNQPGHKALGMVGTMTVK